MIMIELEALNWRFQLLLYIRHDFGYVKSRRQKRPSHHAYRFCYSGRNQKTFIKNLGLKTEEGEFNILAQLLSDNSHFPLRVSIFDGETKGSNLFSVREFGNDCLLYSLDELLRYGDVLNLIQVDETDRVVERKEIPLFDNKAFREAVINAVLHNKWVEGNEPMISVFSDRIEILSRGTLAPAQTMEGFFLDYGNVRERCIFI